MVKKFFGDVRIAGITATAIQRYQQERKKNGIANRTINMDVGALSRVLRHFGLWRTIEERVKPLPETASNIGHALTYEEQHKLLEVASLQSRLGACVSRGSSGGKYVSPAS